MNVCIIIKYYLSYNDCVIIASVLKNDDVEEKQLPLPYAVPIWSGLPEVGDKRYKLAVLKLGSIIETINLMDKPYWVFGRLNNCDISMAHPTISR